MSIQGKSWGRVDDFQPQLPQKFEAPEAPIKLNKLRYQFPYFFIS